MPFYFDLSNSGDAGDPDARKFVVAQRKELGGAAVPTPPLLFMTTDGKVLGEISNYADADKVLAGLLDILKKHPEFAAPAEAEKNVKDPIAKAQILIDLQDIDGARRVLEKEKSDEAQYLLGRLARFRGDWAEMDKRFALVKSAEYASDLKMERAYRFWSDGKFDKLRDHLKDFPEKSKRRTEASYYLGLAHFHTGDKKKAMEIWKTTIVKCAQDPWIYRADWAYSEAKGGSGVFGATGGDGTLLKRIGYLGNKNPDLKKR